MDKTSVSLNIFYINFKTPITPLMLSGKAVFAGTTGAFPYICPSGQPFATACLFYRIAMQFTEKTMKHTLPGIYLPPIPDNFLNYNRFMIFFH